MPKSDEKMGGMSANIKNLTKVQDVLLKSNEKRKEEIHHLALNSEVFQHMIEEIVVTVNGLADGMEKINDKLDKVLENQGKLEVAQAVTDTKVNDLETRIFDAKKCMSGLFTIFMSKWPWIFMITLAVMWGLTNIPDFENFILDFFTVTAKN